MISHATALDQTHAHDVSEPPAVAGQSVEPGRSTLTAHEAPAAAPRSINRWPEQLAWSASTPRASLDGECDADGEHPTAEAAPQEQDHSGNAVADLDVAVASDEAPAEHDAAPAEEQAQTANGVQSERDLVATAEAATAGSGGTLPHLEAIQASFGPHDVSNVRAHVGGKAGDAAAQLGASAFAVGDAVAFAGQPDLHTAAHEAAHVVQQRRGIQLEGGIDKPGDAYERHADEVADAVLARKPAAGLLDRFADRNAKGGAHKPAVQRRSALDPTLVGGLGAQIQIGNVSNARNRVSELDAELGRQLQELGGTLSFQEIQRYVAAFRAQSKYQQANAALIAAGRNLNAFLGTQQGTLGMYSDTTFRLRETQARTEVGAREAIRFVHAARRDRNHRPHRARLDAIERIAIDALVGRIGGYVATRLGGANNENIAHAIADTVAWIDENFIEHYKGIVDLSRLLALKQTLLEFKIAWRFRGGPPRTVAEIAVAKRYIRTLIRQSTPTRVGVIGHRIANAFAGVIRTIDNGRVFLGGANTATLLNAVDEVRTAFDNFRNTRSGPVDARRAAYSDLVGRYRLASRLLAGVGFAASVFQIGARLDEIQRSGGDPVLYGQLIADCVAAFGATLALFPPTAPIGAAIAAIATGVSWLLGLFRDSPAEERGEAKRGILGQIGYDEILVHVFGDPDAPRSIEILEREHVTHAELRALGHQRKWLFQTDNNNSGAMALAAVSAWNHLRTHHDLAEPYRSSLSQFLLQGREDQMLAAVRDVQPPPFTRVDVPKFRDLLGRDAVRD